jgi:alpha-tubulin suppressor-like RCC1 family protein
VIRSPFIVIHVSVETYILYITSCTMTTFESVSKAVKLVKALRGQDDIPWGDTSYLLEKEDVQKLPKAHLRRHLVARTEEIKGGSRRLLSQQLKMSLDKEIEEKRRQEEIENKRIQALVDLEMKGATYSVGSNHRGQLGLGDLEHRRIFTVIPESRGAAFKTVATRNDIVFAISESHQVFTWGASGMGPMAIECKQKRSNFERPQIIESLEEEDIFSIAVGLNHVCATSTTSVCYSWGSGNSGCLGNGEVELQQFPDLISFPLQNGYRKQIQDIDTGEMHCCALSNEGQVYSWGLAANGRLGFNETSRIISIPRLVTIPVEIKMISCGSEHSMAASNSIVYSWGANDGGRLGLGDLDDRNTPCKITSLEGLHIIDISCGTWHSACIAATAIMANGGWLYTWYEVRAF